MYKELEEKGFDIKYGIMTDLLVVAYGDTDIMYLRENDDGSYNTIEFIKYPSAFRKDTYNNTIEKVAEILQSVVNINFKSWGLYEGGKLVNEYPASFSGYSRALGDLVYAYNETGVPHELKLN